jgi:hypothetical protein
MCPEEPLRVDLSLLQDKKRKVSIEVLPRHGGRTPSSNHLAQIQRARPVHKLLEHLAPRGYVRRPPEYILSMLRFRLIDGIIHFDDVPL